VHVLRIASDVLAEYYLAVVGVKCFREAEQQHRFSVMLLLLKYNTHIFKPHSHVFLYLDDLPHGVQADPSGKTKLSFLFRPFLLSELLQKAQQLLLLLSILVNPIPATLHSFPAFWLTSALYPFSVQLLLLGRIVEPFLPVLV